MDRMINIGKFRFLVNKVLPTVYDDTLSYYEVLCKVINKINEIIIVDEQQNEILANIPTDVSQFAEQLAEFKREVEGEMNTFETTINEALDEFEGEIREAITADTTPTQGSTNLITSGGVYAALDDIMSRLIVDAVPTQGSNNLVASGGVYSALQDAIATLNQTIATKQNILTFDVVPTQNSSNPVYSGGVYTAVNNAVTAVTEYVDGEVGADRERISANESAIGNLNTNKQDKLTFDVTPTMGSTNPVTSDGIYGAIAAIPAGTVDPTPTEGSTNAVSSGGVYDALETLETDLQQDISGKQDELTFDVVPTQNSFNPVTSGGVYDAIQNINVNIPIDSVPTQNSTKAVSSGGVYNALTGKQNTLTFDTTPTQGSSNPVTSSGIYNAISSIPGSAVDPTPTEGSTNAVSSGGVYDALGTLETNLQLEISGKQDELTFDSVPTEESLNPVTSDGIYTALDGKQNTLEWDATPTPDSSKSVTSGGISTALTQLGTSLAEAISTKQSALVESTTKTIATTDWNNGAATVTGITDVSPTDKVFFDVPLTELLQWNYFGVYPTAVTANSISFECETTPTENLHFNLVKYGTNN